MSGQNEKKSLMEVLKRKSVLYFAYNHLAETSIMTWLYVESVELKPKSSRFEK